MMHHFTLNCYSNVVFFIDFRTVNGKPRWLWRILRIRVFYFGWFSLPHKGLAQTKMSIICEFVLKMPQQKALLNNPSLRLCIVLLRVSVPVIVPLLELVLVLLHK